MTGGVYRSTLIPPRFIAGPVAFAGFWSRLHDQWRSLHFWLGREAGEE